MTEKILTVRVFVDAKEYDEIRKDAERYRWLRDNDSGDWALCQWSEPDDCYVRDGRNFGYVDAAIDAAMAADASGAA